MTALSYSGISLFNRCKQAYRFRYVEKVDTGPRVTSPAAQRGLDVHQSIEDFLNGAEHLHEEVEKYRDWLTSLRDDMAIPEEAFCLTRDWKPAHWDSEHGMLRGYIDALVVTKGDLTVYEFKTGKKYPEHAKQRSLYAVAALCAFPEEDKVTVISKYFDLDDEVEMVMTRDELELRMSFWEEEVIAVENERFYPANPGPACNWCDFAHKKTGICQFGR